MTRIEKTVRELSELYDFHFKLTRSRLVGKQRESATIEAQGSRKTIHHGDTERGKESSESDLSKTGCGGPGVGDPQRDIPSPPEPGGALRQCSGEKGKGGVG
jgi:hypothetical protein